MMTKEDYDIIAGVLKHAREHALGAAKNHSVADFAIRLTAAMAEALAAQNPRFMRHKFCAAVLPDGRDYSDTFGYPA